MSDRTRDAELAHARLERRALHAQSRGRAGGAADHPFGLAERADNVLAFGMFQGLEAIGSGELRRA